MKKEKKNKVQGISILVDRFTHATDQNSFVLNDGRILKNLKDMADAFEHMSDDVFKHHINESRNDFSNWSREVLNESELAEDLQKTQSCANAQLVVLKHIAKKAF